MVKLVPMSADEFTAYLAKAVAGYAEEHVKAGNWSADEALQKSEKEFHGLLPDGVASKDNYLYIITDAESGAKVGILWIARMERKPAPFAFVYDVEIDEAYRRMGYGSQAFSALEDKVKSLGLNEIRLHVFGHSHGARAMYEKLGFVATNIQMSKKIES